MTELGLPHDRREALAARAAALRKELRAVERLLAADEELRRAAGDLDDNGTARQPAGDEPAPGPRTVEVLAAALAGAEGSLSLGELTDAVRSHGLLADSPDPRAAVRVALTRMVDDGSAVKFARGRWIAPTDGGAPQE